MPPAPAAGARGRRTKSRHALGRLGGARLRTWNPGEGVPLARGAPERRRTCASEMSVPLHTPAAKDKLCLALRVLLRPVHMEHLWTATGPTPEALHLRQTGGRPLSGTARLLVLAAFDLWNHDGHADFGELVHRLGIEHFVPLLSLALAVKLDAVQLDEGDAIDEWLAEYDPEARVRPIRH
jgi:hypothetical protein